MFGSDAERAEQESCDKRQYPRKSVLLKATLYPINVIADIVIYNASQTGVLGETHLNLAVGQTVHISVDGRDFCSGIVRWSRGRQFGLDLDDPLAALGCPDGVGEIEHGEAVGHRHRSKRVAINVAARLATGPVPRAATVRNVSRTGMLIDVHDGLAQGQRMLVKLTNRPPILGSVQWTRAGALGFKADEPISTLKLVYSSD